MAQQGQHLRVLVATGPNKRLNTPCRVSLTQKLLETSPSLCTCSIQASFGVVFVLLMQRILIIKPVSTCLAAKLLCVSFKPGIAAIRGCQHSTGMEIQLQCVPGQGSSESQHSPAQVPCKDPVDPQSDLGLQAGLQEHQCCTSSERQ